MVMKHHPPDYNANALALYESRPDATIRPLVADLGAIPQTLQNWARAAGLSRPRGRRAEAPAEPPTPLGDGERRAAHEGPRGGGATRDPEEAGQVFRRRDALVNRFQFVTDHQRRYGWIGQPGRRPTLEYGQCTGNRTAPTASQDPCRAP